MNWIQHQKLKSIVNIHKLKQVNFLYGTIFSVKWEKTWET